MKYLLPILLLMCIACEESETTTADSRAIRKSCVDFGQQERAWYDSSGQGEVVFNGDCSAKLTEGCSTVFTYGDIEEFPTSDNRFKGSMRVNVISGYEWPGCWPPGAHDCEFDLVTMSDEHDMLSIKCLDEYTSIVFTTIAPPEE